VAALKSRFSLKSLMKAHPEYWYFLFIPGYLLGFFLMEALVPADCDYFVCWLPLDDRIPFLEFFVIPYVLWYPFLFGTGMLLLLRDIPEMKRYVWFMIIGFGLTMLFCVLFPNGQNLRPEAFPRENVFTRMIAGLYAADTNTNVLPSMHVIGSVAAAIAVCRSKPNRRWRVPAVILAVLISVSTVLIKQHSVLDVFVGLALCIPLWFLIYYRKKETKK